MELMQEEDRRSGLVTHLGSWVHGNNVFTFETIETPPLRATPTAQQQYYFDRAHKFFIFGFPRNLRYHFKFESKHFAGLESA